MSSLPFAGIRVADTSRLLTGRLLAQMFADQGASVFVERDPDARPTELDEYFDRNKTAVAPGELAATDTMDVVVVDGRGAVDRLPGQFVVRVVAALPDDPVYGHLPDDCGDDVLNALVGFFTDMGQTSRLLGRPVIYTPLPLCSVYAAVNGANLLAAALLDRERSGQGREIWVSRLAGGVSAIGALALTSTGLPEHLASPGRRRPSGLTSEAFGRLVVEARADGRKQLWLEEHVSPLSTPFPTADGSLAMCIGGANRGLAARMLQGLGIHDEVLRSGFVDVTPYRPENVRFRGRNLGDPMTLSWEHSQELAELVAEAFRQRTAEEWERILCTEYRVPCVKIRSWEEWRADASARASLIFAPVDGLAGQQIGRVGWVDSARPYPPLRACTPGRVDGVPTRDLAATPAAEAPVRPLAGLTVVDFCNVVAGPNCGRMFAELGATVVKIDPIDPAHGPTIMVGWAGESGTGKRSVILDTASPEGRSIMNRIVAGADVVVANKLDDQWERIGIDRASLDAVKPGIVQVALTGHRGESPAGERHDYPGYDPALQGATGIMTRFGPDGCPTFHGLASCVDYLCGYLGTWAGLCALYAQERRGDRAGDWAETSLAVAATLTQCLLQYAAEPPTARGAEATGSSAGARVYELADGWIYADAGHDLTAELAGRSRDDALAALQEQGILAVPVQTCRELADRHLRTPTPTVRYEHRAHDGWVVGAFDATWFAVDGTPLGSPAPAHRVGSDAVAVLGELGYSAEDVERLVAARVVGATEFANA